MFLGRDVFRGDVPTGLPLCGKGAELTDSLLSRFKDMGVTSLYVEGNPAWNGGGKSSRELVQELDHRFSKTIDEPLNAMLYAIYRAHLIKATGGDGSERTE